jgi:2-polyprenyl-6-methoxyphenol hydroxylase-like FAD-dependent oxidoreductase
VEPSQKKSVLISGAGVAGIIAAISLDKEKYDISIVEKADSFRNIGFSIVLWKSGFELLSELFAERGHPLVPNQDDYAIDRFVLFGGTQIRKLKESEAKGYAWVFERKHLMELLEGLLRQSLPESALSFGKTVADIRVQEGEKAGVKFSDGSHKEYDLVIIAEGIYSMTRPLIFEERIISLPWRLLYAWFDKETNFLDHAGFFFTTGYAAVIHPPHVRNLLGFYFHKGYREEAEINFEKKILKVIKAKGGGETSIDMKTSNIFDLREIHLESYSHRNVVCIGDAAHGRPPTIGFGTSMAIEDAVLLGRMLNAVPQEDFAQHISSVLNRFSHKRMPRIERVYKLQAQVHRCITDSPFLVRVIAFLAPLGLAAYFDRRLKELADYKLPKVS